MSSFPKAARIPLFVLGLPISIGAMLTAQAGYVGLGVALFLIIMLVSKVLSTHDQELTQLSLSRSATEEERERAVAAEATAIEERTRATRIAFLDHLTGLPNRRSLMASLEARLSTGTRGQPAGALAIVDLDGFKPINDAFGHGAGDAVLRVVGNRLSEALSSSQECARLGGDEFAVLLPDCVSDECAKAAGEKVLSVLSNPISVDNREFTISGCCGMTMLKFGDNSSDALVKADIALYDCKHRGKSAVGIFSSAMEISRLRRLNVEEKLRDPVATSLISLAFQPIFQLQSGTLSSFEALARWHLPDLGDVEPSEFIMAAEQIGVVKEISDALFKKAVSEALTWPSWVSLSFNLSAPQLCAPELAEDMLQEIAASGLDPRRLEVEITETLLLVNFDAARRNLAQLRASGVRVVVDDFGAGYASISYLQEMQFDGVKIDGSLVKTATKSVHSYRLLKGVIELCASLAVPCVAEHIETEEQYNLLRELGCARGQGHLLGCAVNSNVARDLATSSSSVLKLDSFLMHGKRPHFSRANSPKPSVPFTGHDQGLRRNP
ncbi:MAG TPA: EAL domain-containing protein [Sphingomicrobium sp.]|nr:EAL domain-containing protein [Sphingomicrobium sp.]